MNTYGYVEGNPLYWIDPYGLSGTNDASSRNGRGVIGDPIKRPGPHTDQSGRVPRTGNPISGTKIQNPIRTPEQTAYRRGVNGALRGSTGGTIGMDISTGLIRFGGPAAVGSLLIHSPEMGCATRDCDGDGLDDITGEPLFYSSENDMCR